MKKKTTIPKVDCHRCLGEGELPDIHALRARRIASGLTLKDMHEATGYCTTHIFGAEHGKFPALEPFAGLYVQRLLDAEKSTKAKQ